jgi:hemerythrin-like domain-containing protein
MESTMSQAIDTLMREHRFIEKVLGSLETFVDQLGAGQEEARQYIAEYAEFFREFADRCHHGKEEDQLFEALGDHGFPRDAGPIFVMFGEHNLGRSYIKVLSSIGADDGPLSDAELGKFRESAGAFIPLLRMHIQKEDEILFPAAERVLPVEVHEQLSVGFDEFERIVMGEEAHSRLHSLGQRVYDRIWILMAGQHYRMIVTG